MLEFNMPVHEGWNIVHIAMQVPQSHQIFVCPENCARGVVMTAVEMGAGGRFSCVNVSERDLISDSLESVTIEGASEVMEELREGGEEPRAVFLFTVCSHRILSCDFSYVFARLEERFPEIRWIHGFMDCIAQKEGPSPDMKLRDAMYSFIPKTSSHRLTVNLLGGEVVSGEVDNDLVKVLASRGIAVRQLSHIKTFDEYLMLGDACLNICMHPPADGAVRAFSERIGAGYLRMLPFFQLERLLENIRALEDHAQKQPDITALDSAGKDHPDSISHCSHAEVPERLRDAFMAIADYEKNGYGQVLQGLKQLRQQLGDIPLAIDSMAITCPYSLAKLLFEAGFKVSAVISDGAAWYERDICAELEKEHLQLMTISPTDIRLREESYRRRLREQAEGRRLREQAEGRQTQTPPQDGPGQVNHGDQDSAAQNPPDKSSRLLAIGPMAAWVFGTGHFVDQIENDGAYGILGIFSLIEKMREAMAEEKDIERTVSVKGRGSSRCAM